MTNKSATTLKALISGAAAGALNGVFGGGGGMLLVPLLTRWLKLEEKRAFATSVMIIMPMCAVSSAVYLLRGGLDFMAALPYLLGGGSGGIVAGRLLKRLPVKLLRRGMAVLIVISGLKTLLWP